MQLTEVVRTSGLLYNVLDLQTVTEHVTDGSCVCMCVCVCGTPAI